MRQLLYQRKTFVIPNYQRGYKWSVKMEGRDSAVEHLLKDLDRAEDKGQRYFLQGITVCEETDQVVLIDGQQRVTTLYLLLWCLDKTKICDIQLNYNIRDDSKEFIHRLKESGFDPATGDNQYQDIFYFKQAIEQIQGYIKDWDAERRQKLITFLLGSVSILYIRIDRDKAVKTFTMMNGAKAIMLQEELVKAEMLRKVSWPEVSEREISTSTEEALCDLKEIIAKELETNAIRSRYAREWDKWLYWWNRQEVRRFFGVDNPLGLLLQYYYRRRTTKKELDFANFQTLIASKFETKAHFKGLRDFQKSFEDIFNNAVKHNYLGLVLSVAGKPEFDAINHFIENKNDEEKLRDYALWRLAGATHRETIESVTSKDENGKDVLVREKKAGEMYDSICSDDAYYDPTHKENVFTYLLWLNVREDNQLGRKFDFGIRANRSLEHIHPKSKVYHTNTEGVLVDGAGNVLTQKTIDSIGDGTWLCRDDFDENGSEHGIGNLVLLYSNENSGFGNKSVQEKKKAYFDIRSGFGSRHLLHTISVFAKDNWGVQEIRDNKAAIMKQFAEEDYGFLKER